MSNEKKNAIVKRGKQVANEDVNMVMLSSCLFN